MIRTVLKTIPGVRPTVLRVRRAYKDHFSLRKVLADTFLAGEGVEIGALHNPLRVPRSVRVHYVDRMPVAELRQQYPELAQEDLVPVDIIDDGEKLMTFKDKSQDFIIANHFIEHAQDPIGTIKQFLRVLRPGGILYMAVPDKRYTFDVGRPLTSLDHLIRDHAEGPERSRESHFREWAEIVALKTGDALEPEVQRLMQMNYSIHFHVWTAITLLEFLFALQTQLGLAFAIEATLRNGMEIICVLRNELRPSPQ
jgi:SAM-dependent methyltransferase